MNQPKEITTIKDALNSVEGMGWEEYTHLCKYLDKLIKVGISDGIDEDVSAEIQWQKERVASQISLRAMIFVIHCTKLMVT